MGRAAAIVAAGLQLMLSAAVLCHAAVTSAPRLPVNMSLWEGIPLPSSREHQDIAGPGSKLFAVAQLHKSVKFERFWERTLLQHGRIVENFEQVCSGELSLEGEGGDVGPDLGLGTVGKTTSPLAPPSKGPLVHPVGQCLGACAIPCHGSAGPWPPCAAA